jgi:Ala-tRNA(Pro) deacylase
MSEQLIETSYLRLKNFLVEHGVRYREYEHKPEGRCDVVSQMRGNSVEQAAKAMVIMVKTGKKSRCYYLAVVPGNCRIDLDRLRTHVRGSHAMFTPVQKAEELTGCPMGAVPPLSFHPDLRVAFDPRLLENEELFFNAGRLDRSFAVDTGSFVEAAKPEILPLAE